MMVPPATPPPGGDTQSGGESRERMSGTGRSGRSGPAASSRRGARPPEGWWIPANSSAWPDGVVAVGGDLEPETLLAAYRAGAFPMPLKEIGSMVWWSPDPRGVLHLERFAPSRSLRRSIRRYETTIDESFREVVEGCADPARPHGWITPEIAQAYNRLHELGWAHSIEVWYEGELAGGMYGVGIGALFAGESMFHRSRDASKVAVARMVELLRPYQAGVFDVQWATPHLVSLGSGEIDREEYLRRVSIATEQPGPFDPGS